MAMGPAPSRRTRRGRTPMADINVTPLVDVMLVLLIIFMVTAPLLSAGVPVDLPDSNAKPLNQNPSEISLSITPDGLSIWAKQHWHPAAWRRLWPKFRRVRTASRRRSRCELTKASTTERLWR
jgi:biopolymer transport protein ExbD